jgi:hypothetical protein
LALRLRPVLRDDRDRPPRLVLVRCLVTMDGPLERGA